MIGNEIEFEEWNRYTNKNEIKKGLVVDAYTDVCGNAKGENFLGFGEMKGSIKSRRVYRVQVTWKHSGEVSFYDVAAVYVKRITKFAGQITVDLDKKVFN